MATHTKILIVITKSNWGGAQRYVYDLATSLTDRYDVSVAAGGSGILFDRLKEKSVLTHWVSSLGRDIEATSDLKAFLELYRLFRRTQPDIVHLNSSKAGVLGAAAARLAGVRRIIFTVHGWPFNEPVSPLSKAFRWCASLATLLLAHQSIAVSHFVEMHAPLGLSMTMIHAVIPEPTFLHREEAREKLTLEKDELIIGTIAELHKNKGLDILLEAVPQVTGATFIIIGEGEERTSLENQIAKLKLGKKVFLKGFIFNAASLLKAFDILVLPSRTEALGYVLLEAGFAGVPVVATMVGGIPEVIDDQLSGALVPAYDPDALAEALNELIKNPNTRAHYAERLKEKVTRKFSLQGMIAKTIAVYES